MLGFNDGSLYEPGVFHQDPDPFILGEMFPFKVVFIDFFLGSYDVLGFFIELHQDIPEGCFGEGLIFEVLHYFRLLAFFFQVFQACPAFAAAWEMIDFHIARV
jgi:hypothetical protein